MRFDIPSSWTPTAENIDALPDPLRRCIHDLQADKDPVGPMRENFRLRREIVALRKDLDAARGRDRVAVSSDLDLFYFTAKRA